MEKSLIDLIGLNLSEKENNQIVEELYYRLCDKMTMSEFSESYKTDKRSIIINMNDKITDYSLKCYKLEKTIKEVSDKLISRLDAGDESMRDLIIKLVGVKGIIIHDIKNGIELSEEAINYLKTNLQ